MTDPLPEAKRHGGDASGRGPVITPAAAAVGFRRLLLCGASRRVAFLGVVCRARLGASAAPGSRSGRRIAIRPLLRLSLSPPAGPFARSAFQALATDPQEGGGCVEADATPDPRRPSAPVFAQCDTHGPCSLTSAGRRNERSRDSIACLRMAVYRTAFPIEASAEAVWEVLTDFGSYGEWNPSLPSISGELRVGSTVSLTLGMPGRPSPKVEATLGDVAPGRRLTWHGNAGADWLFAGDREFLIDRQPDGTVLVTHTEDVHGALLPAVPCSHGKRDPTEPRRLQCSAEGTNRSTRTYCTAVSAVGVQRCVGSRSHPRLRVLVRGNLAAAPGGVRDSPRAVGACAACGPRTRGPLARLRPAHR